MPFTSDRNTVVFPANGYGIMDGGIPFLLVAPTMLEPEPITNPAVCYRAMRAVLRAAGREV